MLEDAIASPWPTCAMFGGLGFCDVQTLLQSGNVVFHGSPAQTASLERRLEAETKRRFGIDVDYLVRSAKEFQRVLADNPFPREAERDPSHLVVMFLKETARTRPVQTLKDSIRGRETLRHAANSCTSFTRMGSVPQSSPAPPSKNTWPPAARGATGTPCSS